MSVDLNNNLAFNDVQDRYAKIGFYAVSALILITATIGIGIIGGKVYDGIISPSYGLTSAVIGIITTVTLIAFCAQCIRCVNDIKNLPAANE